MQPLLRYNQYEQGKQIHVASWPYSECILRPFRDMRLTLGSALFGPLVYPG